MTLTNDEINSIAQAVAARLEMRMETYIAAQSERCKAHHEQTSDHAKELYGNGRPGIVADVQDIRLIARIAVFLAGGATLAVISAVTAQLLQ